MAAYLIVHGAFGGGWEWREVARLLRSRGHDVFTPSLTGLGERAHLLRGDTDFETHVADVLAILDAEQLDRVVLCGQSYGGAVVTAVADRASDRLGRLVYIDALIPEDGECVLDLVPRSANPDIWASFDTDSNRQRVPFTPGDLAQVAEGERSYLARLTDQPLATVTQPIRLTGAGARVPTTYIRCVSPDDMVSKAIESSAERARRRPWRYLELAGPHDAHWWLPDEVAALLDRIGAAP